MYSVKRIQHYRRELVEAKIRLRHAENDLGDAETSFKAGVDFVALGKNNDDRKLALADLLLTSKQLAELRQISRTAQDASDIAEAKLEVALDERRAFENETFAKAVDHLRGRVDHIGNAPRQAVKEEIVDEITGQILQVVEDDSIPF